MMVVSGCPPGVRYRGRCLTIHIPLPKCGGRGRSIDGDCMFLSDKTLNISRRGDSDNNRAMMAEVESGSSTGFPVDFLPNSGFYKD